MSPDAGELLRGLLNRLRIVEGAENEERLIDEMMAPKGPIIVSFLNQHGLNLAAENTHFRECLGSVDILLRDGVGIEVALRLLRRSAGRNTNGTDLIPKILRRAVNRRVALFGTGEPWLSTAKAEIVRLGVDVVATLDGFQSDDRYIDLLNRSRPEVVVLAMGMPRQERLAVHLKAHAKSPILIVNGGAVLDFLANRFSRAPGWVQAVRMEWAYRLAQEPQRLGPRYFAGGIRFLTHILKLRVAAPQRRYS